MELFYDMFLYAFTAVLLSLAVSKLISLAVSSGEVSGGKEQCAGGVGEGNLENRLKVKGLKSLKKRRKKVSCETVLLSEFKGETESAVADESLAGLVKADDDRKGLASSDKNLESLQTEVSEACSAADQLLSEGEVGGMVSSVIREEDGCFGVDAPVENEGLISSSEITLNERVVEEECKEVGCSVEGFEQEINLGNDLQILVVYDQRTDYKEDDVAGEELGRCGFNPKEEAGSVGHGDEELVNVVLPSERREISEELSEQDVGSELKIDDSIDVGLLGVENVVDDHHENQKILESFETESKVSTQDGYVAQVDDQNEELMSSVSKEDAVNRDEERRIGENAVDGTQHKLDRILDSLESALKDSTQGGADEVDDWNEEIRNEEGNIGDEDTGEMEISDGEEWEGIERNELERDFAKAMNFVECGNKDGQLSTLGSDVTMQFYGLQKVSMEGPCHESPPMALKLSARAKWSAWQKLGSMIPEEAMEKYINLLSEKVPGWMGEHPFVEEGKLSSEEDGACSSLDASISTALTLPLTCVDESRRVEDPVMRADDLTVNSSSVNKDEE